MTLNHYAELPSMWVIGPVLELELFWALQNIVQGAEAQKYEKD